MIHTERAALTRQSWAMVRMHHHAFARHLEETLVARTPALALLLADADVAAAARRLVHAVDVAVRDLERLHASAERTRTPADRALGAARAGRDDAMGATLIAALESFLGVACFTPRVRDAWWGTWADVCAALRTPTAASVAA